MSTDELEIDLRNGHIVRIDAADYALVSQFRWYATKPGKSAGFYASARIKVNGRKTTLYMHRLITGAPRGKEVDHLNHDTLDNRRANLRVGSHKDNMANGKFALKTHCPAGHAYSPANTYINKKGKRICRACNAIRVKAIHRKLREGMPDRRFRANRVVR